MSLRFGVLGPLEVTRDGEPVAVGSGKARALLATLLLCANEVVSVDALVERIWDGDGPRNARASLQTHITRLRATLGADCLRTHAHGYTVAADADTLDLLAFDRLVAAAGHAAPVEAVDLLRQALGLWRGEPLSNVDSDALHRQDVAPLLERRLAVTARRAELGLGLGNHAELTAELRRLTALHPHREGLWALFMRALYGAGRQAEALQAYRDVRALLADDLGIEPGPDLRRLHQRMLGGEDLAERADVRPAPAAPNTLPRDLPDFAGRAEHLAVIASAAESADGKALVITAIDGMAGIGKTALAVHAAHRLARRFPHGCLYIDLHGFTAGRRPVEPFDALGTLMVSLGLPAEQLPDHLDARIARWRAEMNDREAIVVLDNAASAAQLAPLLPAAPGSLVLVTCRKRLPGLDGVHAVSIDVLPEPAAVDLFHRISGRIGEPGEAAEIVALCGRLPLAIRIAAARLAHRPSWTVAHLARRLRDGSRRLAELAADNRGVAAAFSTSYDQLSEQGRRVFRRLGLMPCANLDLHGVAAVTGTLPQEAEPALDELIGTHLVQEVATGDGVRYTFHDLLRDYARDRAMSEEDTADRAAAQRRLLDYYTCSLYHADAAYFPEDDREFPAAIVAEPAHRPVFDNRQQATRWLHAERAILHDIAQAALDSGHHDHAVEIPKLLSRFLSGAHFAKEDVDAQSIAVAAARRKGDPAQVAQRLNNLGSALDVAGRYAEALEPLREALAIFREIDNPAWSAVVLGNMSSSLCTLGKLDEALSAAHDGRALAERANAPRFTAFATYHAAVALIELGRHAEGEHHARAALAQFADCEDWYSHTVVEGTLGEVLGLRGHHAQALVHLKQCTDTLEARGDRTELAEALAKTARVHHAAGALDKAFSIFCDVVDLCRQIHHAHMEAVSLEGMAQILDARRLPTARDHWHQALAIYERLGLPDQTRARARLAEDKHAAW